MKKALLFSLILSAFAITFGQNKILFKAETREPYLVRYNQGGISGRITNLMLERIAKGMDRPASNMEFEFEYKQLLRLTQTSPVKYEIYAHLNNPVVSGYNSYKSFNISHLLLPEKVNFDIQLKDPKNGVVETYSFRDARLDEQPAILAKFISTDSSGAFINCSPLVTNKEFVYSKTANTQFNEYTGWIDSYHEFALILKDMEAKLRAINPQILETVVAQQKDLTTLRLRIDNASGREFMRGLQIGPQNDPRGYLPQIQSLSAQAAAKQQVMDQAVANLPVLFYERGIVGIKAGQIPPAIADFNSAVNLDPMFAPAHYELARYDFNKGTPDPAAGRIADILNRMNPDPSTRQVSLNLAKEIQFAFIDLGQRAEQGGVFETALEWYNKSNQFCNSIAQLPCSNENLNGINRSLAGLYNQRLNGASAALEQNNPDQAEAALADAVSFRKLNQGTAFDTGREAQLYDRVKNIRYINYINAAKDAYNKGDFAFSLQEFEKAKQLEGNYNIVKDADLPNLIMLSAKNRVLALNAEGKELASANDLLHARNAATNARTLAQKYNLKGDPEVSASFEGIEGAIFNQECINAQNEFTDLLNNAKSLSSQKRFIDASAAFDAAISFASRDKMCGIDATPAMDGKREILPAVDYQKKMVNVNGAISKGQYDDALNFYTDAGNHFASQNVSTFGLQHLDEFTFIKSNRNLRFVHHGAGHYAKRDAFTESIELMSKLLSLRYSKKLLKPIQTKVGVRLASIDVKRIPNANPKVQVLEYTSGEKGLNYLKKAYIKQFKSLL